MMKPRVSVLWFPGTNCHHEMMRAFVLAGAKPELVLLNLLLEGKRRLTNADIVAIPGGFSFGDHFGSGRVAAFELVQQFLDQLQELRDRRVPMIGICNGFQILVAAGLLPGNDMIGVPSALLDLNLSNRFEHWGNTQIVLHEPAGIKNVWTSKLDGVSIRMPVAHGEGRPVPQGDAPKWNVVGTYETYEGVADYPQSPNGSAIAGICNATGETAGFMPHPERRIEEVRGGDQGLAIYQAGVDAVR